MLFILIVSFNQLPSHLAICFRKLIKDVWVVVLQTLQNSCRQCLAVFVM